MTGGMPRKPPVPPPSSDATPTKFQAFSMQRLARGALKAAPYNPRVIDAYAKKKIQANLGKVGLMAPITVNKRTGHVVGGHQRLAALDALEGSEAYALDVALVDLSLEEEKQQNLFMNNPAAQGQWDLDALEEMLRELDTKGLDAAGFDLVDLETLYPGDTPWLTQFDPNRAAPAAQQMAGDLQGLAGDAAPPPPDPEEVAKRLANGLAQKERQKGEALAEDTETYAVVMFKTRAEREDFMELLGVSRGDRYVSGARAWAALGVTRPG